MNKVYYYLIIKKLNNLLFAQFANSFIPIKDLTPIY